MKPKGFAWMALHDPIRLREVSRAGGLVSQGKGKGSRWTREQARALASTGGRARWQGKKKKGAA